MSTDTVDDEPIEEMAAEGTSAQDEPAPLRLIRSAEVLSEQVEPLFASSSVRVVTRRVIKSLEEAGVAVEQAHHEAERIIEEARAEALAVREKAREAGHSQGLQEAVEYVTRARQEYNTLIEGAEDDLLEMAFRLAQRIVGQAIELQPSLIRPMVAKVLRHARGKREIVVSVAPEDLDVLEQDTDEFRRQLDGVPVHFEADADLERGSCVVQTQSGRIDGRIETQLATLQRALRGG